MKVLFRESDPQLLGNSTIVFEWRPNGTHIAVGGSAGIVCLYDRYGQRLEEARIGGFTKIDILRWSSDGEVLAIASSQSGHVQLFEQSTRKITQLDVTTGTRALATFMKWSNIHPILVTGNNHGHIVIYNYQSTKRIALMSKHQRQITSGDFLDSVFALGSEDLTITINNLDGDTVQTLTCNAEPSHVKLSKFKRTDVPRDKEELFISYISGNRTVCIAPLEQEESLVSLQFNDRYGQIIDTEWHSNGIIIVAFEGGFISVLSALDFKSVSEELLSVQEFTRPITCLHANAGCSKLFIGGDTGQVKIRNLADINELNDIIDSNGDSKPVSRVACTLDGSLCAISTDTPSLVVYLTRLPQVFASYQNRVAVVSALTEVSIYEDNTTHNPLIFNAEVEPSVLAIGHRHIAVAFNNQVWFYEYKRQVVTFLYVMDYVTTVLDLKLNKEYVMVVMEKGIQLHPIIPTETNEDRSQNFPEESKATEKIVKADLMDKFLIYVTDKNRIRYFSLIDWAYAADYKHMSIVTNIFGEQTGIRSVFFDGNYNAFLYHPSEDEAFPFPELHTASSFKTCLWETFTVDKDSVVLADVNNIYAFVISRNSHGEQNVTHVGTAKLPYNNIPVSLSNGVICCYTESGKLNTLLLNSHKSDVSVDGKTKQQLLDLLDQSVKLKRWRNAWKLCDRMDDIDAWNKLGEEAMRSVDMELAIRVYRKIGKASMVSALEDLKDIEEENLLSGHLMALLGEFDKADELFCLSSEPLQALDMRRNILDWDRALKLAQEMAKDQLPFVSLEYATQLDFMGQYSEALLHFESALLNVDDHLNEDVDEQKIEEHNTTCEEGIARVLLRLGEVQRGIQIAQGIPGRLIKRDCGQILESMRLYSEAAQMYEQGQYYDRAAAAYIKAKNWTRIMAIEEFIRSPKILTQLGKLLFADKRYDQAYSVFERARSYDNMIMILLKHLNRPDEAVQIARECRSSEGSRMVAKFFSEMGDENSAIEFLVLSQCFQEAYDMALSHQKVNIYADVVAEYGAVQQFIQLAHYFDSVNQPAQAGRFYGLAKEYETCLNRLISAGDNEEAIGYAVEFTAQSNNSMLVDRLVNYLMGEPEGVPKDPKFLFQMYTRLGMHAKAAKIALIIAIEEQSRGSYRSAHTLLFTMRDQLKKHKMYIPTELDNYLMILHSYIIVRRHVQADDQLTAARLLVRVSNNISRFPQHETDILTSTLITCAKANLKETAYRLALKLTQPPYKGKVKPNYKKTVETIVRKAKDKNATLTDPPEHLTACPQCGSLVKEFELKCDDCKINLPYCIVTGKHVISSDFALCASCQMPGFSSELQRVFEAGEVCPMCSSQGAGILTKDVKSYLEESNRQP